MKHYSEELKAAMGEKRVPPQNKHSAIKFVTPAERHRGEDEAMLARRRTVYEAARVRHPERWAGRLRN